MEDIIQYVSYIHNSVPDTYSTENLYLQPEPKFVTASAMDVSSGHLMLTVTAKIKSLRVDKNTLETRGGLKVEIRVRGVSPCRYVLDPFAYRR